MKLKALVLAGWICLTFLGCKKNFPEQTEEEKALQEDTFYSYTLLSVEGLVNELEYMVKQAPAEMQTGTILSCASIAKQTTAEGTKIDITFNSNTICTDNTRRSGKISITYNQTTGDILLQPSEYVVSNMLITGTYSFKKFTENNVEKMSLMTSNGKFTLTDGSFIKFAIEKKTKVKAVNTTTDMNDDDIEVEQAYYDLELAYQNTSVAVAAELKSPYLLKYACTEKFRPRAGSLTFQRSNGKKRLISFGSGNCNDVPSLTDAP